MFTQTLTTRDQYSDDLVIDPVGGRMGSFAAGKFYASFVY
jgi:hypothetical protein